jgi:hypothetical protein
MNKMYRKQPVAGHPWREALQGHRFGNHPTATRGFSTSMEHPQRDLLCCCMQQGGHFQRKDGSGKVMNPLLHRWHPG